MTRREQEILQQKLSQARKQAAAIIDPVKTERAVQTIEDLEYQLLAGRIVFQAIEAGY